MKTCTKCGVCKDQGCFAKDPQKSDGLSSACKDCNNARRRMPDVRARHRAAIQQKRANYLAAHPKTKTSPELKSQRRREARARFAAKHPDRVKESVAHQNAKNFESLPDATVANLMKMRLCEVPKQVIDLKREHLRLVRLLKEMK